MLRSWFLRLHESTCLLHESLPDEDGDFLPESYIQFFFLTSSHGIELEFIVHVTIKSVVKSLLQGLDTIQPQVF